MNDFKDHFSSGSVGYASYRPDYPPALIDHLAELSPGCERALDCGCGTGQLSVLLAKRFNDVIATDASAAQIASAEACKSVSYRVAHAEASGLPDASVDLITVAQAAHWLDLEKFYAEVRRVARPDAIVALITYGVLHVEGEVDALVQDFYYNTLRPYWPPERSHVEDGYRRLALPFAELEFPDVAIEVSWQLEDLLGYFNTWSAVKVATKAMGKNPVDEFAPAMAKAWGDRHIRRRVVWPLSGRIGRV